MKGTQEVLERSVTMTQGDEQQERLHKKRKLEKGFTLVEMLAVVVILVIVAGVGFVVVNRQIETSRNNTDISNLRTIADAANRYIMDGNNAANLDTGGTGTRLTTTSPLIGNYLGQAPASPWNGDSPNTYLITVNTTARTVTVASPHTTNTNNANNAGNTTQFNY